MVVAHIIEVGQWRAARTRQMRRSRREARTRQMRRSRREARTKQMRQSRRERARNQRCSVVVCMYRWPCEVGAMPKGMLTRSQSPRLRMRVLQRLRMRILLLRVHHRHREYGHLLGSAQLGCHRFIQPLSSLQCGSGRDQFAQVSQ
jgi:hypothetical protein